jgi:alpha-galactosidase
VGQIKGWERMRQELVTEKPLEHRRTGEYGSYIMESMETGKLMRLGGNVLNRGAITNLPAKACVEIACLVDRSGIHPCYVGDLPPQLAAVNMTSINVQELTIQAALTGKRDYIYQAALLDPHTAAELTIDQIRSLVDELIAAHGEMLPRYH